MSQDMWNAEFSDLNTCVVFLSPLFSVCFLTLLVRWRVKEFPFHLILCITICLGGEPAMTPAVSQCEAISVMSSVSQFRHGILDFIRTYPHLS